MFYPIIHRISETIMINFNNIPRSIVSNVFFFKPIYIPTVIFLLSIADVKFSTSCKMASDVDLFHWKPYLFSLENFFNEIVCSDNFFFNILENSGSNDIGLYFENGFTHHF